MILQIVLLFLALVAVCPAQAQSRTFETPKPRAETTRIKPVTANPCAQLGPGFVRLEGSQTCVKIGGSVSVGVGVGVSR